MDTNTLKMLSDINFSIIKVRSIYASWSKNNNINYHEMLILYSLRDNTACTQKQICDSYFLPKQTINNIVTDLKEKGYIRLTADKFNKKLKVLELTDEGKKYSDKYMNSLKEKEEKAVQIFGFEKLNQIVLLLNEYGNILDNFINNKEVIKNEK